MISASVDCLQEWIFMNYWIFRMGIGANITMMFLLWWFHLKEESGDHLDSCLKQLHTHTQHSFGSSLSLPARLFVFVHGLNNSQFQARGF